MKINAENTHDKTTDTYTCKVQVVSGSFITIMVTGDTINTITFEGRPRPTPHVQKRSAMYASTDTNRDGEECHRTSLEVIKKEICNKFVGRTLSTFSTTRRFEPNKEADIEQIAKQIAEAWRVAACESQNIFRGSKTHNNFAGKLCLLLKPHFEKGEDAFKAALKDANGKYEIAIPKLNFQHDEDFYLSIRRELKTDKIILNSWEDLCEWYFGANFDESSLPQIPTGMQRFLAQPTSAAINANANAARTRGICRFKEAYKLSNLYQLPIDEASTTAQTTAKRRKTGDGEADEEITATNSADTSQPRK